MLSPVTLTKVNAFDADLLGDLPRLPADLVTSEKVFGATCGPMALAAVLGTFVCEVMRFFPYFPERTHTTPRDMAYALASCGAFHTPIRREFPTIGVAMIQIDGPWTLHPGAGRHALLYRHWIACSGRFVFDSNVGDWLERDEWLNAGIFAWLNGIPKATGWHPRQAFELAPQSFQFSPFGRVPIRS